MAKEHPIFYGEVKDGKLKLQRPELFNMYLGTLEGEVKVDVRKYYPARSLAQNDYYWSGVVTPIADWIGDDTESVHTDLKAEFLKEPRKRLAHIKSTTKLDRLEMIDYIKRVMEWAAKNGLYLETSEEWEKRTGNKPFRRNYEN